MSIERKMSTSSCGATESDFIPTLLVLMLLGRVQMFYMLFVEGDFCDYLHWQHFQT